MSYTGWELDEADRVRLLAAFPPAYPDVIAEHVTFSMGTHALPPQTLGDVVGIADDENGVQALVVEITGLNRPDGGTFHITWSIDRKAGRKPFHSNKVIESGYQKVDPIAINLIPKVFE